jgi:microcystin-dependent protein
MSQPFLGEIRAFSFTFAPKGWALCDGVILPINQNQALFALLGTTYGGDGQSTFALPDLRGRTPTHFGGAEGYLQGEPIGVESVTLTDSDMPSHVHQVSASAAASADQVAPTRSLWANSGHTAWSSDRPDVSMAGNAITATAAAQPHENRSPFLVISFAISLQGIFPSRT